MKKYTIKRNTVEETLLLPLYGRKLAMDLYPDLFTDKACKTLLQQIDYPEPQNPPQNTHDIKLKIGAILAGTRQNNMATVCRNYLHQHPEACVVNLGCGLDTTFYLVDNQHAHGYNIDLPDVIDIRNQLLPPTTNETNIAHDITDITWFDNLDFTPEKGAVFFASGVFYYIRKQQVIGLLTQMAKAFPGAKIVFDATTPAGLKKMLKTWLKDNDVCPENMTSKHPSDYRNYFSVKNIEELRHYSDLFSKVSQKGYMTGYHKLDRRFGLLANLFFHFLDRIKWAQMIEIEFAYDRHI